MDTQNLIKDVLYRRTWMTRDNSNTQVSPSLVDYFIYSQGLEDFALKRLYSRPVSRAHREGSIYIHTLHSVLKPYCNGIDARLFLLDGLRHFLDLHPIDLALLSLSLYVQLIKLRQVFPSEK